MVAAPVPRRIPIGAVGARKVFARLSKSWRVFDDPGRFPATDWRVPAALARLRRRRSKARWELSEDGSADLDQTPLLEQPPCCGHESVRTDPIPEARREVRSRIQTHARTARRGAPDRRGICPRSPPRYGGASQPSSLRIRAAGGNSNPARRRSRVSLCCNRCP
jgi:hypothetical protein